MKKILLSGAAIIALSAGAAQAATATTSFQAKVIIGAACTVNATDLDFGTQGIISSNVDQTSTIAVTCTTNTPYNVGIDAGTFGSGVSTRKMKVSAAATDALSYSLYKDSARTLNWGNTIGTDTLTGVGSGTIQNLPVYGRLPTQATVQPGSYYDKLQVTVTY